MIRRSLSGVVVVSALAVMGQAPAVASEPSPQTVDLCSGSVPCSVQVARTWIEGTTGEVAVTGEPGTTVDVRAFRVETTGERTVLRPFGPAVEVTTDDHGFGGAGLELPALADDEEPGPVLIALADSEGPDLSLVLGSWTTLASRSPLVLGDGYDTAKPVGVDLDLHVTATLPGARFDVEIERGGQWEPIGGTSQSCAEVAVTCAVTYQVPRGLTPERHRVRIVDADSGTPVGEWTVLPTAEGVPAERAPLPETQEVGSAVPGTMTGASQAVPRPRGQDLDIPDIAADVEGAAQDSPPGYDPGTVRRAGLLLGGLAALLALLGVVRGVTRGAVRRG